MRTLKDPGSKDGDQITSGGEHDNPDQLNRMKSALRKLVEVYDRLDSLTAKKFGPAIREFSPLLNRSSGKGNVERDVRNLEDGLLALIKLVTRRQESFAKVRDVAKRFEGSNSVGEITMLIGLTLLPDHKEHVDGLNQIVKISENKILPTLPTLTGLVKLAGELEKLCKWTQQILNCDPDTQEDDILRMVSAIENRDIDRFDNIHEKLDQRLKMEESK
jgi:hypothetical protein